MSLFPRSTGLQQEAREKYHAEWPAHVPGQHLWMVLTMYRVVPPRERYDLDMENLLSIEGPGCLWCEEPWSEGLAVRRCYGQPVG